MRLAALVFLCVPFTLRASPLDPQLSAQFTTLREGIAPRMTGADLSTEKSRLIKKTESFAKLFAINRQLNTANCARYNALVGQMSRDIARTLGAFNGVVHDVNQPLAIDAHVRLQFELPSFERLAGFFKDSREGGYGLIDRNNKTACTYANRAAVDDAFQSLAKDYSHFLKDALGTPGQLDLERTTEHLLTLALRQETSAGRTSAAVNAGLLVASLVTWQFGPPILLAGFDKVFGAAGAQLATKGWFKTGAFWTAMVTEMMAQNKFAEYMLPASAQRREFDPSQIQIRFPSWEEHIRDMEKLASTELHEPQLYLAYMSSLTAQLARVIQNWVHANKDSLKTAADGDAEFARVLAETGHLNREAMQLNDTIPSVATQKFPQMLANDWHVRVDCGADKWVADLNPFARMFTPAFMSPTEIQCLIGQRRVARAFYSGAVKPPEESVGTLATINVSTLKDFALSTSEISVRIDLPYKQPSNRMAEYITAAFGSDEVKARLKFLAQFSTTLETYNQGAVQKIDFDPELSVVERWAGLNTLLEIKQNEPSVLRHDTVVLYVTKRASTLSEAHLGLRIGIAADASYEDTLEHLKTFQTNAMVANARAELANLRARVELVGRDIKSTWQIAPRCDDEGSLTLTQCLRTLTRIKSFAKSYPKVRPQAEELLVIGYGAPGGQFEMAQTNEAKPKMLFMIRHGFKNTQLLDYVSMQGWATARP